MAKAKHKVTEAVRRGGSRSRYPEDIAKDVTPFDQSDYMCYGGLWPLTAIHNPDLPVGAPDRIEAFWFTPKPGVRAAVGLCDPPDEGLLGIVLELSDGSVIEQRHNTFRLDDLRAAIVWLNANAPTSERMAKRKKDWVIQMGADGNDVVEGVQRLLK